MAQKLTGMLNLSKIPKGLIFDTKKGDKAIFLDICPNKNGADEYGNTHYIRLYNKATKENIYLGNLKPETYGQGQSQAPAPQSASPIEEDDEALPF